MVRLQLSVWKSQLRQCTRNKKAQWKVTSFLAKLLSRQSVGLTLKFFSSLEVVNSLRESVILEPSAPWRRAQEECPADLVAALLKFPRNSESEFSLWLSAPRLGEDAVGRCPGFDLLMGCFSFLLAGECRGRRPGVLQWQGLLPDFGADDEIRKRSDGWKQPADVPHPLSRTARCVHGRQKCLHRNKMQFPSSSGWHC